MPRQDTIKACEKCGREFQARGFKWHAVSCKGTGAGPVPSQGSAAEESLPDPEPKPAPADPPAEPSPADRSIRRGRFRA